MATHHISEKIRCSVSRTATDSRDTVELGDYQQTVGWEVVNTKSRLVSGLARNPLVISFHP